MTEAGVEVRGVHEGEEEVGEREKREWAGGRKIFVK